MNISHYLASALSRKEVYHFLDTHGRAYPLGAVLVGLLSRRQLGRRRRRARPGVGRGPGPVKADNVSVPRSQRRPARAIGNGRRTKPGKLVAHVGRLGTGKSYTAAYNVQKG